MTFLSITAILFNEFLVAIFRPSHKMHGQIELFRLLRCYAILHPRRWKISFTLQWKPEITTLQ